MLLGLYRLRLDRIMRSFARALGDLVRAVWDPRRPLGLQPGVVPAVTAVVVQHRERAYDAAAEFLQESAARQGVEDPVYVPDLAFYPEASVETVLREDLRGPVDEAVRRISGRLSVHVENAARSTVTRAVEDGVDPVDPVDVDHMERSRLSPGEVARRKVEERAARRVERRQRPRKEVPTGIWSDDDDASDRAWDDLEAELDAEQATASERDAAWDALEAELEREQAEARELDRIAAAERDPVLKEAAQKASRVDGPRPAGRSEVSARQLYLDKKTAERLRAGYNYEGARPKSWARVLTGAENCGFCVVLASRGAVYKSARSAGVGKASEVLGAPDATGYLNTYHDNCDCLVVPVYDFKNWDGLEQWSAVEEFYEQTIRQAQWVDDDGEVQVGIDARRGPSPGSGNQVFNAVERKLRELAREGGTMPIEDLRKLGREIARKHS